MTKQEAIEYLEDYIAPPRIGSKFVGNGLEESVKIGIECIKMCIELGSCKECKSADFCYDHPDVCFCLQHDHTMYADDTCNYFYRERS